MNDDSRIVPDKKCTRDIIEVWYPQDGGSWLAGRNGCKRITAYNECGEMAYVPYIRIEMDNGTEHHIAARHLGVTYKTDEPKEVTQ